MDLKKKSPKKIDLKILLDNLINSSIIQSDFTGKITISLTCGGVNYIEKTETYK